MNLFAAQFSHYRRHPLQLLALALMIVLATTLWTGVNHLTERARASLAQSEQAVAGQQQIVSDDGQALTVRDFAALRRAGHCVMPWLEVQRPAPDGRVIGVDPFSAACFGDGAPGQAGSAALNGDPFLDISEAAALSAQGYTSVLSLLVPANVAAAGLPSGYRLKPFSLGPATGELGESFLLNLDALAVLVLLITALLVRSVYQLGLAQRRESFALLERFGVPASRVRRLLLAEMVAMAAICVVPGIWFGRWLAEMLGSGFGQALEGLFDMPVYAVDDGGFTLPALVMGAVVLVACFTDRRMLSKVPGVATFRPSLWLVVLLFGVALVSRAPNLGWLFTGLALVFVAVGLLTPGLLSGALQRWAARAEGLAQWRRGELAVLFRRLALPVVALQFAVAMVLAVQALVTTFEDTFDAWLAQRLEAEFYVEVPDDATASDGVAYLQGLSGVGDWHLVQRGSAELVTADSGPEVDLFAISPVGRLLTGWPLLEAATGAWDRLASGEGVMVNEQLARRQGYRPGDLIAFNLGNRTLEFPVLGVYADYGRPAGEVLVAGQVLPDAFRPRFESFSLNPGTLAMADIKQGLASVWHSGSPTVRDNSSIRALASGVFDQTFLLTRAITMLTLILAGASLLIMGWVFFSSRAWYYRLLSVWGLSRREVTAQLRWLALSLTGTVAVVALPLGVWLTWVLVARINPLAFGWSLPMAVYPRFWLEMLGLCLVIGVAIATLMRRQLRGQVPAPAMAHVAGGGER
ncbi:MAG: FtsX-like permease family protein [Pseudomonadota bacterium]